jgi:hypothetical protein
MPMFGAGYARWKRTWAFPMPRRVAVSIAFLLAMAVSASAADALALARRLVSYTGGVGAVLHNFESGLAAQTAAPDVFLQSFQQAMTDNQAAIAAEDEKLAQIYSHLYPVDQMEAEIAFYESPEAQELMRKSRETYGVVVWPDPGAPGVTPEQGAALVKFHSLVKQRAALAAKNADASDAIMAAETDLLVKVRAAAFANYCKLRDCNAEKVILPTQ